MIVKNESKCIQRCLKHVKPYINYAVVCDTGSDDNTVELIKEAFEMFNIEGEVHQDKWINFGENRQLSLERCKGKGDYVLILDADEIIVKGDFLPIKNDDYNGYMGHQVTHWCEYDLMRIVRNDGTWKWHNPVHEYVACSLSDAKVNKSTLTIRDLGDGGRNLSGVKFYNDASILEKELQKKPNDSRIIFYLAQTLENIGSLFKAKDMYMRRVNLGGWEEEVYYSLYRVAEIDYVLGEKNIINAVESYLKAYNYRSSRYESLLSCCEKLRKANLLNTLYSVSKNYKSKPCDDLLFVNHHARWRLVEEHALSCFYLNKKIEARNAYEFLLETFTIPEVDKNRISEGLSFCNK